MTQSQTDFANFFKELKKTADMKKEAEYRQEVLSSCQDFLHTYEGIWKGPDYAQETSSTLDSERSNESDLQEEPAPMEPEALSAQAARVEATTKMAEHLLKYEKVLIINAYEHPAVMDKKQPLQRDSVEHLWKTSVAQIHLKERFPSTKIIKQLQKLLDLFKSKG